MEPADTQNRRAIKPTVASVRWLTDAQFDFGESFPLRKSYVIASSDRAASIPLCRLLWQTGCFGAPWEYLRSGLDEKHGTLAAPADRSIVSTMMQRFGARNPGAYVARILACRTSSNGVFGLKSHFEDLKSALNEFPNLLNALAPVTYLYVDRRDKLTHAASTAKSLLAKRHATVGSAGNDAPLFYDRDLISKSLGKLERRHLQWWRWFEANGIAPFVIYHEDVNADEAEAVHSVAKILDVACDTTDQLVLPPFDQPPDEMAEEWAARFRHEIAYGIDIAQSEPAPTAGASVISDFAQMSSHPSSEESETSADPVGADGQDLRALLPRYDQIIGSNQALLRDAIVLDLMSGRGICSLAALEAGAAFVTGVDPRTKYATAGARTLADRGIPERSYQFVTMGVMKALYETAPETFGVIIGRGVLERVDIRSFFAQLKHLRPNHVILDTGVASGQGPLVRFGLRPASAGGSGQARNRPSIITVPNHDLIVLLCDSFGFTWRLADEPDTSGGRTAVPGRAGVQTSTYILDRIE